MVLLRKGRVYWLRAKYWSALVYRWGSEYFEGIYWEKRRTGNWRYCNAVVVWSREGQSGIAAMCADSWGIDPVWFCGSAGYLHTIWRSIRNTRFSRASGEIHTVWSCGVDCWVEEIGRNWGSRDAVWCSRSILEVLSIRWDKAWIYVKKVADRPARFKEHLKNGIAQIAITESSKIEPEANQNQ